MTKAAIEEFLALPKIEKEEIIRKNSMSVKPNIVAADSEAQVLEESKGSGDVIVNEEEKEGSGGSLGNLNTKIKDPSEGKLNRSKLDKDSERIDLRQNRSNSNQSSSNKDVQKQSNKKKNRFTRELDDEERTPSLAAVQEGSLDIEEQNSPAKEDECIAERMNKTKSRSVSEKNPLRKSPEISQI